MISRSPKAIVQKYRLKVTQTFVKRDLPIEKCPFKVLHDEPVDFSTPRNKVPTCLFKNRPQNSLAKPLLTWNTNSLTTPEFGNPIQLLTENAGPKLQIFLNDVTTRLRGEICLDHEGHFDIQKLISPETTISIKSPTCNITYNSIHWDDGPVPSPSFMVSLDGEKITFNKDIITATDIQITSKEFALESKMEAYGSINVVAPDGKISVDSTMLAHGSINLVALDLKILKSSCIKSQKCYLKSSLLLNEGTIDSDILFDVNNVLNFGEIKFRSTLAVYLTGHFLNQTTGIISSETGCLFLRGQKEQARDAKLDLNSMDKTEVVKSTKLFENHGTLNILHACSNDCDVKNKYKIEANGTLCLDIPSLLENDGFIGASVINLVGSASSKFKNTRSVIGKIVCIDDIDVDNKGTIEAKVESAIIVDSFFQSPNAILTSQTGYLEARQIQNAGHILSTEDSLWIQLRGNGHLTNSNIIESKKDLKFSGGGNFENEAKSFVKVHEGHLHLEGNIVVLNEGNFEALSACLDITDFQEHGEFACGDIKIGKALMLRFGAETTGNLFSVFPFLFFS